MRNVYIPTLIIVLGLGGLLFLSLNQESRREIFEQRVLSMSSNMYSQVQASDKEVLSPDQPDMAAFQEFLMTFDPETGVVPKRRLVQAYSQSEKLQKEQFSNRSVNNLIQWETDGSNMGGRTRAIMFDPNDPDNKKVWAGGVTGGLWYVDDITDLNMNWVPVDDFWSNLAISCITYDPNNTQTFYVGTGEAQTARIIYRESSGLGTGIFKTNDGGLTWELISSTNEFDYITDIAVRDENGTSVIYACVVSGTYKGENHLSEPSEGLYRSDNGGNSWVQVLPEIEGSDNIYSPADIEISANGRIFIGTMENLELEGGATILYSDTGLEGSWNIYANYNDIISAESYYKIPARTLVASAPSDPNTVYAQFAAGYYGKYSFIYYRGRYMIKSQDGGASWSQINIPDDGWSTLAWHAFVLKVSPDNPNSIITGGLDLWKSNNAGTSWSHISDWLGMYWGGGSDYVHGDQQAIAFRPGDPNTAIFSTDGGVFLSENTSNTYPDFTERNQGYGTLQFYTCAARPSVLSKQFIGGTQDNMTLLHKSGPVDITDYLTGGDGAYCFWDQDQVNVFITSVYYNRYFFFMNEEEVAGIDDESGTFISPADYDYKENILYSNAVRFDGTLNNRILRVKGVPNSIQSSRIVLETNTFVPYSHVKYSTYSPEGTSTLFIGTTSGSLYKVLNAEDDPETTEIGSMYFPTANISCVAIGESEDELLVTFSNYGVSSVWLTMNGGETWTEKENNLPDMPIRWAIFHPENNGQALLATEIGVWSTNTLQENNTMWEPVVNGMANVRVDMIKIRESDNMVIAATHGRGMFTGVYPLDAYYVGTEDKNQASNHFVIYPTPAGDQINIKGAIDISSLKVYDLTGKLVHEESGISNDETIDISILSSGTYVFEIASKGLVERQQIVVK